MKPLKPDDLNMFAPSATTLKSSLDDMPRIERSAPAKPKEQGSESTLSSPTANKPARPPASTPAKSQADVIAAIAALVTEKGKDTTYVRLTQPEKQSLLDVVYTYRRQSVQLTENDVVRVAIAALLDDYKANGANSLLVNVIRAMNL